MKKALEEKKREKEADKIAKEQIKRQIEQDKKDRAARVILKSYILSYIDSTWCNRWRRNDSRDKACLHQPPSLNLM